MEDDAKRAEVLVTKEKKKKKEKKPFLHRDSVVKGKEMRRDVMKSSSFVLLPDVLNINKQSYFTLPFF